MTQCLESLHPLTACSAKIVGALWMAGIGLKMLFLGSSTTKTTCIAMPESSESLVFGIVFNNCN